MRRCLGNHPPTCRRAAPRSAPTYDSTMQLDTCIEREVIQDVLEPRE